MLLLFKKSPGGSGPVPLPVAQSGAWSVSILGTVDVSDRAARLVGIVYGDVGQLLQRAVTRDALVQLRTAAVEYDARQIRAITTADAINVGQWIGSAAPTVGQKAMASSVPVVIASDQSSIPVSSAAPLVTYYAATTELTLGTAVGRQRILSFFHPVGVTLRYRILEVILNFKVVHTVGVGLYSWQFISAESATGTVLTPQAADHSDAATGASVRQAPTADTALGNQVRAFTGSLSAIAARVVRIPLIDVRGLDGYGEKPPQLPPSVARGILVFCDVTSALTTAPVVQAIVKWTEQ